LQSLHEQLLASFEKTFNFTNLHNNLQNSNNLKTNTITINGNSTVNLYHNNKNMQIKHSNKVNRNSHNINTEITENTDSHNVISSTGDLNLKSDLGLNLNFDLENKLLHSLIHLNKNKKGISLNTKNFLPPKVIKKKSILPREPRPISYHPEMSKNIKKEHIEVIKNIPKPEPVENLPPIVMPQNETEKIVNNNYEVHNHIYLNDNSLNLINSLHSKLFSMNSTNPSAAGHQILIGNGTYDKFNLSHVNSENLIVINQGDVSENITHNKIEKLVENKPIENNLAEIHLNKTMNDVVELNHEIQKLKDELNLHKVLLNEKIQVKLLPQEEKPILPIVEEKKPELLIEEKKSEPIVKVKIPDSIVQVKKPDSIVQVKKPDSIVQVKKPKPLVKESKPEPLVKEKKPEPLVEEKKPQPIIEEKKPQPIIEEKKPQPIIEEKKPQPIIEEKVVFAANKTETPTPIVISQVHQEEIKILSNQTQSKIENVKTETVQEKPIVKLKTSESFPSKPSSNHTTHTSQPDIKVAPQPEEKKPQQEEIKPQPEEIKPQTKPQPEKIHEKEKPNYTPAPEPMVITQKHENKTLIFNKTQPLPEIVEKPKVEEILKSFPAEPENESNEPPIEKLLVLPTQVKPKEQLPKAEIKNETVTPSKEANKTESIIPAPEALAAVPLVSILKVNNKTHEEKINVTHIEQPHVEKPYHEKSNLTHADNPPAKKPHQESTKTHKPQTEVNKTKESNVTTSPEKPMHEEKKAKNETFHEKDMYIKYTNPLHFNKTKIEPLSSEINVKYVNKTKFNQTIKYTNGTIHIKNTTKEVPKENFVKLKTVNMTKKETVQMKTVKEHTPCNKDDLCKRCDKQMICRKCGKNSFYNLIEGKCVCNRGYFQSKELKECVKCHPLCDVCSGRSSSNCLTCKENAEFLKFHTCVCKKGFKFDRVLEMCLDKSDLLAIKHTKPQTCKGNNYWEPRISECTEPFNNRTKELKFATVLYLGGNTSPEGLNEDGTDILKQQWNSANDITPGGMRQNFISGLYFREKFINFYNLAGEKFNPELVQVSAAGKKAAVKGSYSFLLGLMPTLANIVDKEFYDPKLYVGKDDIKMEETLSYSNITKKSKKGNKTSNFVNVNQVTGNAKLNRTSSSSQILNSTNVNQTTLKKSKLKMKSNRLQEDNKKHKKYSKASTLLQKNSTINDTVENTTQTNKQKKKGSMKATTQKTEDAVKNKVKKIKTYTHEELDNIKKYDGKNPFQDDNDTEVLFEDIAPILPLVPSHTPIQSFSRDYGISDLSICKGIQEYIKKNTELNRIKGEKIIAKIQSKFNLHHYFHLPSITKITPELMTNLTLAFFANYNTNNKNITKMYIPKSIITLIQEFNDLQIYGNLFGDKHNYVAKAVLTPYAEQFLKNVDDEINHEYKSIVKSMKKYYKKRILDLNPLGEFKKLSFFFPDQQIFWAMMAFLSKLKGEQIPIPLTAAGVSFELSKIKKKDFNLTNYILNYNQFIYSEEKAAKKKKNQTMVSGGVSNNTISNSPPALNRSVSTSSSNSNEMTRDSKDVKEEKNNKLKNPKNKTEKAKNKTKKNNRFDFEELRDKRFMFEMEGDGMSRKNKTKKKEKNQETQTANSVSQSETAEKVEKSKSEKSEDSSKDKKKKGKKKDSKDKKDKKDSKDMKNAQEFDATANFIINNNVNLMQDLNRKFRNPNLYSIKVYFNHELIFDQSYLAFRDKLKEFIVDKDELRDFCFPPKTDIWLIICIALFASIVFQLLVIACLYTIKH
jgi:hypothetical protein